MPEERIAADVIIVAVGQKIETEAFEKAGLAADKGAFTSLTGGQAENGGIIVVGGECVTGPATAIRAIAAGKVAAANIDEFLGYHHEISIDINIPKPSSLSNKPQHGRINTSMRTAFERKCDFDCIENGLTDEGAAAESLRCLRCDYFGYGSFRGGREKKW
jgi:pyruvate/2-oxoglutarate dehydrogenase complex dihydrolipoamide dehydrogenase (E3) component